MTSPTEVLTAFEDFKGAVQAKLPQHVEELRPPVPFEVEWHKRPGAEEILELWSVTSGQPDGTFGICGGLRLLGPHDSELERAKWHDLFDRSDFEAVAQPTWDNSRSLDPDAVLGVYFAAGWIPVLCEPLEANYLAVDLVPLPGGRPGQIVLCGRDEEDKVVVAPNLATVLRALAAECRAGEWEVKPTQTSSPAGNYQKYLERLSGRLLSDCSDHTFPPTSYL